MDSAEEPRGGVKFIFCQAAPAQRSTPGRGWLALLFVGVAVAVRQLGRRKGQRAPSTFRHHL